MKQRKNILFPLTFIHVCHEQIRWSNALINSPTFYTLIERRIMYFLTGEVKRKYVEKGLGVPEKWKDLYFYLTDRDLGVIGGKKNIPRTYEALSRLGGKLYPVRCKDEKGNEKVGYIHWVDSFFYDKAKGLYAIRVSPELMRYLINLKRDFTVLDLGTALSLKSRFSQKMYEICCEFSGSFRYRDCSGLNGDLSYKERVLPINIDSFRNLFNLDETRDPRTGKIRTPTMYRDYSDIRRNILEIAQKELYSMYMNHHSDVWFDFQPGPKKGIGGKVSSIIIFIYTREHPKTGEQPPWRKGDVPLCPYDYSEKQKDVKQTPYQKLRSNMWYGSDGLELVVCQLLARYLSKSEVAYYMREIQKEAVCHKDSYVQVIQVIQEKERQPKFSKGTRQYKRNNIIDYALQENLKEFGWSIKPPSSKKDRVGEQAFFEL